jgi:hypothetical protein
MAMTMAGGGDTLITSIPPLRRYLFSSESRLGLRW